jgi:hypothetical protein
VTYTAPSSDTATTSISIDSIPVVSAGADVAICTGNSTVLTATGATTYSWSTGETTASITVDPTTNTTYTVTGFNGACSATDSVDVTVNPLPSVSISGTLTYCVGASTTLDAGAGFASYSWSSGETTQTISATAGNYTVTVTDSNGCSNTSAQVSVTELALPNVAISGTLSYCAGSNTTLTATAGLSSYLWSSGETTQSITATAGSYTVTGTDSNGCSNTSSSVTVTETPLDNAGFSYSASSYEPTDADPTPTITGDTGGTFTGTTGLVINSTTGEIDLSASSIASHTVTYTTSGNCPNSSTFALNIVSAAFGYSASAYCQDATDPTPTITGTSGGTFSAAPLFTGLLDTYTGSAAAYSLRRLSSTYTGSSIRVRRNSDNNEQDIGFVNNALDTSSIITFCSGTIGYITTWYDQSGNNRNAQQTSASRQPTIYDGSAVITLNSNPAFNINENTSNMNLNYPSLTGSNSYTVSSVFSAENVTRYTKLISIGPDSTTSGVWYAVNTGGTALEWQSKDTGFAGNGYNNSSGPSVISDSRIIPDSITTQNLLTTVLSSSNAKMFKNGTEISYRVQRTGNCYSSTGNLIIGNSPNLQNGLKANIQELIIWQSDENTNISGIDTNINNFYSIY